MRKEYAKMRRRRSRAATPEVLRALHEGLLTGASAARIRASVVKTYGEDATPSVRTIQDIARDLRRDDSRDWTLEDADPASVAAVLSILRVVHDQSDGRIRVLTVREAKVATAYLAVGLHPWIAYVAARVYLAQVDRGEDTVAEVLRVAQSVGGVPSGITFGRLEETRRAWRDLLEE